MDFVWYNMAIGRASLAFAYRMTISRASTDITWHRLAINMTLCLETYLIQTRQDVAVL